MHVPALLGEHALVDPHAGAAQPGDAPTGDVGGRVAHAQDHPCNPGPDDCVGARSRAAGVAARLEGHVEGRAAGRGTGLAQGPDLGVRASGTVAVGGTEHPAPAHHHRTDAGIGVGRA